jgi:hypothetical protein
MHWNIFKEKPIGEELLALLKERKVLDVGCGNGETALILAAAGCKVIGIDPMLPEETKAAETGGNPQFEQIGFEEFTKRKAWEGVLLFDHSLYVTPSMVEICKFHPKAKIVAIQSAKDRPIEKQQQELKAQGRSTVTKRINLWTMMAPEKQPEGSDFATLEKVCFFTKENGLIKFEYIADVLVAQAIQT